MDPFANESDSMEIGELTIENRIDRISLYGTLTVTKDQAGLKLAKEMLSLMQEITLALESGGALPLKIEEAPKKKVKNPFLKN